MILEGNPNQSLFPQLGFALGVPTSSMQIVRATDCLALPGAPARGPGGPPAIKIMVYHSFITKTSASFLRVFPVKKNVTWVCIVSSWSDFRPGKLAEVV